MDVHQEPPPATDFRRTENSATKSDILDVKLDHFQCYQITKSTSLGLGAPQGYKLDIRCTNSSVDDQAGYFHTGVIAWWQQKFFLPANFEIMRGPRPEGKSSKQVAANVKYQSLEGMFHMKAKLTLHPMAEGQNLVTEEQTVDVQSKAIEVRRKGWTRQYDLAFHPLGLRLMWKGTKRALDLLDDDAPECNGNLKLVNEMDPFQPEVLAVWKNRTDPHMLGALWVSETFLERSDITLEDIVYTCLAVVVAERLNARGWLGGATHSKN